MIEWELIAGAYRLLLENRVLVADLDAIVGIHTRTEPGKRPFLVPKAWDRPGAQL